MRIAWCLAAILCAASAVTAQSVIEWSSEKRLSKADFKGRAPVGGSNTSMSWLNIDASWECEAGELFATARATFDPARSWWRTAQGNIWESAGSRTSGVSRTHAEARRSMVQRDVQLLEHEQLHFDLTELAVRRIRRRFVDLKDACDDPDKKEDLRVAIADIDRELQEEQSRYDRETGHGTNPVSQDQWMRRIRKQLEQP
jgi:Bacterial protein of unknown function (DUF922)